MSSTLIHARSELVTREALRDLPTPPATDTWKPVAHIDLIDALDRQLRVRDLTIAREQFALQRAGLRLFAVLDLALWGEEEHFTAALGLRTSNDQSLSTEIVAGARVLVCDNLAFSGEVVVMRRKHTPKFTLHGDLAVAMDRYQEHLLGFKRHLENLRNVSLADEEAQAMIFQAFDRDILPLRLFPTVAATYFHPKEEMADVEPRSAWGLMNAMTRAVKQLAPAPAFHATARLGKFFKEAVR
jgi:hypothetical protein